jgi:hypothetical protein
MVDVETSLLMVVLVLVILHLVDVEVEQVLVDGLVAVEEAVVPLVLFVVLFFSAVLAAAEVEEEVLTV